MLPCIEHTKHESFYAPNASTACSYMPTSAQWCCQNHTSRTDGDHQRDLNEAKCTHIKHTNSNIVQPAVTRVRRVCSKPPGPSPVTSHSHLSSDELWLADKQACTWLQTLQPGLQCVGVPVRPILADFIQIVAQGLWPSHAQWRPKTAMPSATTHWLPGSMRAHQVQHHSQTVP